MIRRNLKNIQPSLKSSLSKQKFEHTISTVYTAMCLAMKYEVNLQQAEIAALLHDCAKCIPNDKKIKECRKHNIKMTEAELANPDLLHAKLGAFMAMNVYHIDDKEIINAILKHTTGAPNMTMLEKILYVADYIEPGRNKADNLTYIRKLAFEDIDKAIFVILGDTLEFLRKKGGAIDVMTNKAYEYYKSFYAN